MLLIRQVKLLKSVIQNQYYYITIKYTRHIRMNYFQKGNGTSESQLTLFTLIILQQNFKQTQIIITANTYKIMLSTYNGPLDGNDIKYMLSFLACCPILQIKQPAAT